MAPTSITSTTTTPAEWEPHTAPTTTASPSSNANTTRTTPFGSTRTSLPDNSRRLKGHGDSATHLSGDREASGDSGGSRWGLSGSRVVLDGDPVSSLRQEAGTWDLAMRALHDSPEASCVLVEAGSATALLYR